VPPLRPVPPGAAPAAAVVVALLEAIDRLRSALAADFEAMRARRALLRAARREVRGRADLLAMARRYASSQPEFAKDLFAAANADGAFS